MGRLYFTEQGRILAAHNEEITRWRWAKKRLIVSDEAARTAADLWLYVCTYDGNRCPLVVSVNLREIGRLAPRSLQSRFWSWHRLPIRRGMLKSGANEIVLSSENPAMNGWMLGLEGGHRDAKSYLSFDRGHTWKNTGLGLYGTETGEYVIRLRSHAQGLRATKTPPIVYENSAHPRVAELVKLIPSTIRRIRDPWRQVLALRTFVARSWSHNPSGRSYAPWDPWTVFDWTQRKAGHGKEGVVAMCVHFGAVFAVLATALGHKARAIVSTRSVNSYDGHFTAEVWDEKRNKWVLHDPNLDVHFEDGSALSAVELMERSRRGASLRGCDRPGPGRPKRPRRLSVFYGKMVLTAVVFRSVGVWLRNDYISNPTVAPPNHGMFTYSETGIAWYTPAPNISEELAMFPHHAKRDFFESRPH